LTLLPSESQDTRQRSDGAEYAITLRDLRKSYGPLQAVDGLSLAVERGEILALLGPNGAGKTTTVEILEGYRRPDSGEVRVLGQDPLKAGRDLKEQVGIMLQQTSLYEMIRVREALDVFCGYYRNPRAASDLIKLIGLESQAETYFVNLSGGQKQRLSLALAIAGNPRVAFLDEPTASMDPQMRLQTWEIIDDLRAGGVTIVLTTHYMEEAQRLANHVAIIDHGGLIAFGTPEDLMRSAASEVVRFTAPPQLDLTPLRSISGMAQIVEERAGAYVFTTSDALDAVAKLATWARERDVPVKDLRVTGASLEDVFLQLTGTPVRE
jgi:ABC-2 type transport system ATP-binding protein